MTTPTSFGSKSAQLTNPKRLWQTAGYYAAFIALGLTTASFGPALPYIAEQTHSQLSLVSSLFAFRSLGYLIGSLRGGHLYDRRPGHPVILFVLLGLAVCIALVPSIPILLPLLVILFFIGLGEGTLDVGGNTLLIWTHGSKVGPFMNGLHFFFGIGAAIAPILIAQAIIRFGHYGPAYWLIGLIMLPIAFAFSRLPSPTNQQAAEGSQSKPYNRLLVILLVLFFFLYVGAEVGFGGWVFTYVTKLNLADEATAAYITSAFWGALTVGRLLGIPISTRLHPSTILWIDLVGCLVSMGIIVLFPGSTLSIWIGALLLGISMASIFPTALSLAEKRLPISGRITGWLFVGASLGGMVLPWVIGQVFDPFGAPIVMVLILADLVLATILYAFIR